MSKVQRIIKTNLKKLLAEFLGTATLVFCICQAVIQTEIGRMNMFGVALVHMFALAFLIYSLGPISGAHLNPAVTLQFFLFGKISLPVGLGYGASQFLGGIFGALLLRMMLSDAIDDITTGEHGTFMGASDVFKPHNFLNAFIAETIMTFFLVYSIWITAVNENTKTKWAPLIIGAVLGSGVYFVGHITNNSLNPARTLGPAFVTMHFRDLEVFMIAPFVGGILAAVLNKLMLLGKVDVEMDMEDEGGDDGDAEKELVEEQA